MTLHVLDTDIVTLLQRKHPTVVAHLSSVSAVDVATTIITVEEQLTGWYSALRRARQPDEIAQVYGRLTEFILNLCPLRILSFTEPAVHRYLALVGLKLNIGKMDLRIAAIALENGATVVTRNLRDFQRVPSLLCEDWTV